MKSPTVLDMTAEELDDFFGHLTSVTVVELIAATCASSEGMDVMVQGLFAFGAFTLICALPFAILRCFLK